VFSAFAFLREGRNVSRPGYGRWVLKPFRHSCFGRHETPLAKLCPLQTQRQIRRRTKIQFHCSLFPKILVQKEKRPRSEERGLL
jgi:hypothetical protein